MGSLEQTHSGHFRAHARLPIRLRAVVTHVHGAWKRQVAIENMGLGGARMVIDAKAQRGDKVTLSLTAPTLWDALVIQAIVAWVAPGEPPYALGIAFEHTSADTLFALCELISTSYE